MRRGLTAGLILCALGTSASAAAAAAKGPRVVYRSTIGGDVTLPVTACASAAEGLKSDAAPLVGAAPGKPEILRAVYQAHGEKLQLAAASDDGGRTWTRQMIDQATACIGGPAERHLSVNPLFDVGGDGAAYFGQSWLNSTSDPVFRFGIAVYGPGGDSAPAGGDDSQNAAVAADPRDPDHVSVLWTRWTQIPNPLTYTPLPNELRFAESRDGGRTWSDARVVHAAPQGELIVNARLVRLEDGALVGLFDRAKLSDFPSGQFAGSAPLEFYALRSGDGTSWSEPVRLATGSVHNSNAVRPEGEAGDGYLVAVKPDLAAGPRGEVVAMWPESGSNTVRIARSHDGARTWESAQDTVRLPGDAFAAAVAIDGRGRPGVSFYDFRHDVAGDGAFTVQPRFATRTKRGWRDFAIDDPFDLDATQSCDSGADPTGLTAACSPGSHAGSLGVYQDVEGLPKGFGVGYTVGPPLARDGFTDARYARVKTGK